MDNILKAISLKEKLDALRPINASLEREIWDRFRLDWNYHSNKIEGNSLTYGETKALLLFNITAQGKPLKDHFEITGHNEAVNWVLDVVKGDRSITENFIRELHKLILKEPYQTKTISQDGIPGTKTVRVGEYKSSDNHVITRTGEIFRFASATETPAMMSDLVSWYVEKVEENYKPILLATEFHYKFIRIHPFDDGNGRTARILMNFILMKFGFPPVIVREDQKEAYLSTLEQADADNTDPFVEFISDRLIESQELMLDAIKSGKVPDDNDIEKRFKLLDARISEISEGGKKSRNQADIDLFKSESASLLYQRLIEAHSKFSEYYDQTMKHYKVDDKNSILFNMDFGNFQRKNIKSFKYVGRIRARYSPNSIDLVYEYLSVNRFWNESIMSLDYGTALNEETLKTIIDFTVNEHIRYIKTKIT